MRHCPVCACREAELLIGIDFMRLPETILPVHYDIVSCPSCGFVYNSAEATQAVFDRHYALHSKYDTPAISGSGQLSGMDKERYQQLIDAVTPFLTGRAQAIADIGCAQGGLLKMCKERGFNDLFGLDPSVSCVTALRQSGIEAEAGALLDFHPPKKFDVVMATEVLEHIYDLQAAAAKLAEIMNDSGLLLVEVPDASRYAEYVTAPLYRFDFEHVNHFSLPHLQNLLGSRGFELVASRTTSHKASRDVLSPSLIALFRKTGKSFFKSDFALKGVITEYIRRPGEREYRAIIDSLADSTKPVLIWGLGAHTARMLRQTRLKDCNIVAFIDSNPHKRGRSLLGKPVYPPDELSRFTAPAPLLLICSVLYGKEMSDFAQEIKYTGELMYLA